MPSSAPKGSGQRHAVVAIACAVFVVAMVGAAYAAVPLYRLFCQVTGFAGSTRVAEVAPDHVSSQTVEVRFDSNVAPGLAWSFEPDVRSVTVKLGETKLIHYRVTSHAKTPTTAAATYNVTPGSAGSHFSKIQCFCFSDQTLQPGEMMEMPVVFFVDPDMLKDEDAAQIKTITLSYTFFPKAPSKAPTVASGQSATKAPL
ncbi:cytochrome c oxidase assembly protein [Ancylobacter sp. 6x-1]|uniref:Cytochrome c oxidase assembly protein CtaG n=2 Tax=Ancylobacter crimeensis TaxID=2579147 RepID=A0ABT0D908_9HYPH|nr:cytochrome c oxidase assembly protein [Ancylobacter crimeensis]